jgi:hypothetical protein
MPAVVCTILFPFIIKWESSSFCYGCFGLDGIFQLYDNFIQTNAAVILAKVLEP